MCTLKHPTCITSNEATKDNRMWKLRVEIAESYTLLVEDMFQGCPKASVEQKIFLGKIIKSFYFNGDKNKIALNYDIIFGIKLHSDRKVDYFRHASRDKESDLHIFNTLKNNRARIDSVENDKFIDAGINK